MKTHFKYLLFYSFIFLNFACSSHFYKHKKFHKSFEKYDFEEADKELSGKQGLKPTGKDRLLFFLNKGVVLHMKRDFESSNKYFEIAYKIIRDTRANIAKNLLGFLLNPSVSDYMGEDHEVLLINYYKALNYLNLSNEDPENRFKHMDAALQECRRMDLALRMLKQTNSKADFKKDAMLYTLMGIIYQANGDYANAYYSYVNAVKTYKEDYQKLFKIEIPNQLKMDLLHSAYVMGFMSDLEWYENLFKIKYDHNSYIKNNNLICIWNNGLGPYKDSFDITFAVNPAVGGLIHFKNDELGLDFAFPIPPTSSDFDITNTSIFRMSYPKYIERKPLYTKAEIEFNNEFYSFELLDDINAIAFKVLRQRMMKEMSEMLLRLFIKKIAENRLSKLNSAVGLVYGVFNAIVEKADTRNWQTIPHNISYVRLKLPEGEQTLKLKFYDNKNKLHTKDLNILVEKERTNFYIFHTFETNK